MPAFCPVKALGLAGKLVLPWGVFLGCGSRTEVPLQLSGHVRA